MKEDNIKIRLCDKKQDLSSGLKNSYRILLSSVNLIFFWCKILFANNMIRSEIHTLIMGTSVNERGQY